MNLVSWLKEAWKIQEKFNRFCIITIMRTTLKWASLVALFFLFSCTHVEEFGDFAKHTKPGVYGSMSPVLSVDEPDSKASVNPETLGYVFEIGDHINIWASSGTLLIYNVEEVSNEGKNCKFIGGGFTLTENETYYSAVPLIRKFNDNFHSLSTTFEDQSQLANGDASHLAEYTYAYASSVCAIKNGVPDASFSYSRLNAYMKFELTLPKALTLKKLEIYVQGNEDFFGLNGTSDIANGAFTAVAKDSVMVLQLGGAEGLVVDGQLNAYLAIAPTQPAEYIIRLTDIDNKVYTSPKIQKNAIPANKFTRFTTEVFEGETPGVAKIGDVAYPTLKDAVAAVPTDGTETTITMIGNDNINVVGSAITIAATKNIILDLNGHQVVGTAEEGSTSALITNKGTLTIKDSSDTNKDGTGSGQLISGATTTWIYEGDGNYAGSYASNTITNSGTLTIESGYIENLSTGSATYAVDNNSSGADAILNMNGGLLKAHSVAVRQFANSATVNNTVNVTGGKITAGYSGIWIQLPGSDATKAMKAALNVTGGILEGGNYAFYDYSYGNSFDATQYNLAGGTYNGDIFSYGANFGITDGTYNGDVAIKQTNPSTVSVSGGKFAGDVWTYGANASKGFITGGVYAINTYEDEGEILDCDWLGCIADGYMAGANTDPATMTDYPYAVIKDTNVYVAKIGDTKYLTLEAAFAAAEDGDTITLLEDCAGNGIVAPQGKFTNGITVDFDGHTYTMDGAMVGSTGTQTQAFQLLKDNKITFKNGTLYSEKAYMLVQNYSDLTLDGMTLTLNKAGYSSAYTLSNNNGNVVINNTTINANPAGGFAFDVCRYDVYPSVNVTVQGTSVINGNIEVFASNSDPKNGISLTVSAGTINGNLVLDPSGAAALKANPEKVVITKADAVTLAAPDGFDWVSNGNNTSTLAPVAYVAQIGETKYESLKDAVAAAQANDVIVLIADDNISLTDGSEIEITKPLTITGAVDANGAPLYTVYGTPDGTGQYNDVFLASTAGTVTISNIKFDGFGNQVTSANGRAPVFIGSSNNNAVISNVYFSNLNCEAIHINGGTFTIQDCNIDCTKSAGSSIFTRGICAVNDASGSVLRTTISGVVGISSAWTGAIEFNGNGNFVVSECTLQASGDYGMGLVAGPVPPTQMGGAQVTMSNTTIDADYIGIYSDGDYGCLTSIASGAYSGYLVVGDNGEGLSISGGVFEDAIEDSYCADGFIPADNTDSATMSDYPYTVVEDTNVYVAKIGDTKYLTLEAAFAAAEDGDEITLLEDCAGNGIQVLPNRFNNSGLTVDFNGHSYTMDGTLVGSTGTQTQAFQLQKDNKITFKNGSLYSTKAKMLIQNYSDLTLQGMTLTLDNPDYAYGYTLSNNNGNVVIDETTINANPAGSTAFDVCRGGGGADYYLSVNVTVQGNSVINGDIEVDAQNGDPKNGFSLTLAEGTTINNGRLKLTNGGSTALINAPDKAVVTKDDEVSLVAPSGFKWESNGSTSTLVPYALWVGNAGFDKLSDAIAAAESGATIKLNADYNATSECTSNSRLPINKSVTIDGNEHELIVAGRGLAPGLNAGSNVDVTIQNVDILNTSSGARCIDTRGNIGTLTLSNVTLSTDGASGTTQPLTIGGNQSNAANVVITNSTIETNADGTAYYAIITFNPVNMTVTNSTLKGWACIYAKGADGSAGSAGSVITVSNSTVVSKNNYNGTTNSFGTIMIEDNNVKVDIANSNINITNTGTEYQALVAYPDDNLAGNQVTVTGGNLQFNNTGSGRCVYVANQGANNTFAISSSLFDDNFVLDGYEGVEGANGMHSIIKSN